MKKLVLASLLASVSTLAFAGTGVYVQGDVGYSKMTIKQAGSDHDTNKAVKLSAGRDLGAWRWAVDYTTYGSVTVPEQHVDTIVAADGKVVLDHDTKIKRKAQSVGAMAFYEFGSAPIHGFTPYVGVRVGLNEIKAVSMSVVDRRAYDQDGEFVSYLSGLDAKSKVDKKTKFGGGVQAGVHYAITPNLGVDVNVEYNHLGKVGNAKLTQQGAKLGVRYTF